MERSIERFVNTYNNGLYLIDMPTGTGKTTQAVNYIFNHYKENRKFIYITSLKKNVEDAYNKLKDLFVKNNLQEEFEAKTLRLYANADKVIENIADLKIDPNDRIMKFESFINLRKEVEVLNRTEKMDPIIKEKFEKDIREKFEPEFRKDLKNYICDKKRTKKERFYFIKDNHRWLIKLYPSILTNFRNIFFTTIDKFYLGSDTIIEPTYKFINNQSIVKDTIVFIDEIDATKSTILNRQIDESLKNNIDLIQLFLNIHSTLNNKDFPKEMLIPSQLDVSKERDEEGIIEKMKKVFNETFDDNKMNYAFKLLEKDDDRKFIFDDNSILTISKESKITDLYIVSSEKENYNRIILNKAKESKSLQNIIRKIGGAITYFINGCYILAINYCNSYNERKKDNDDIMQIDDSVSSIIKAFNINERFINYLSNVLLSKGMNNFVNIGGLSTNIYKTGFRYYKFKDSITNNLSTEITMFDLNDTPENFLLNICKKSYVIGLSATSTMDTVTGNYDLRYLKQNLGENYYIETEEDNKRVNNNIEKIIESNKSNIYVELENVDDVSSMIDFIFKDKDHQDYFKNIVGRHKSKKDEYNNKRFIKVLLAINSFIRAKLPSLLILCNRNLGSLSDDLYSKSSYEKAVDFIIRENNIEDKYEIINLLTREFEQTKYKYHKLLKEGIKVIIISSYPTTGAGQNLQFEYEDEGMIKREDLSSIYIEKPTNMLVNTLLFNETTNNDLIKYIFQVEALKNNGEISIKDKNICIREGFLRTSDQESYRRHSNLYDCNSIRNQALSVLIQAVGRICRVRNKSGNTAIFVDYDIVTELDLLSIQKRKLNKEFKAIIDVAKETNINKTNSDVFSLDIQKAENDNKTINDIIHSMLSNQNWSESDIEIWKSLREQVLKKPCTNDEFGNNNRFFSCYFSILNTLLDKYYYKQENDYGYVKIGLKQDSITSSEVSNEDCKIKKLMSIDFIRDKFIEKGYAIDFKQSNYIMLPVIYNNIYKGALGEVIGKIIIDYLGYELEEINEGNKFERFDYHYKNIYIDFKFWSNKGQNLDIEKVKEKAIEVSAEYAIVINILGNANESLKSSKNVIVIPALIDENNMTLNKNAINYLNKLLGDAK